MQRKKEKRETHTLTIGADLNPHLLLDSGNIQLQAHCKRVPPYLRHPVRARLDPNSPSTSTYSEPLQSPKFCRVNHCDILLQTERRRAYTFRKIPIAKGISLQFHPYLIHLGPSRLVNPFPPRTRFMLLFCIRRCSYSRLLHLTGFVCVIGQGSYLTPRMIP